MTVLGVDANCGLNFALVAAGDRQFHIGYLRTDGGELKDPPWALTRAVVEDAASHGVKTGAVCQNDHTMEIWRGRGGIAPGYSIGRANAEIFRDLVRPIAGRAVDLIASVDQQTSIDGRGETEPVGPPLDYLKGWKSVIGRRLAVYGSRYTIYRAAAAELCPAGYWQSFLLDGLYRGASVSAHPAATWVQDGNADQELELSRFGVPILGPSYSYVGHDRTCNGATLADLPVWLPS